MNYKKQIILSLVVIIAFSAGLAIPGIRDLFFSGECARHYGEHFGRCLEVAMFPDEYQSLSLFLVILAIFHIILYFLKSHVYRSWRTFALVYLPIVGIILFIAPTSAGNFGFDRESLTFFFSGVFAIVSAILMIVKSVRGKSTKDTSSRLA
jgi:hypothetical protein